MTETPTQPDERPRTGLATENLRSYERLRRSVTDRKIAGVAGGLGRHLNVDPTVLRVLLVVLVFFGGAGIALYAAAWLLVPEEGSDRAVIRTSPSTRNALLIVVTVLAALAVIGDSWGGVGFPWPLALLALVLAVVLLNRDGSRPSPAGPQEATTPAPHRGPTLFGPTVALLLVALGALGLFDSAGGAVTDAAYPALALAVIGVMLLVGSVVGRPGGLILLGVLTTLALLIASAANDEWSSDTQLASTPATAADVRDSYDVTAGQIRLDLTEVEDLENLDGRRLDLEAAAGEILVLVPGGIDVDVDAGIRLGGEIEVDGVNESGNGVDLVRSIDGGDAYGDDLPRLTLELDLTVGHIEVRQEDAA